MLKVPLIDNLPHKIGIRHHNTNAMSWNPRRRPPIPSPRNAMLTYWIKRGDKKLPHDCDHAAEPGMHVHSRRVI